MIITNGSKEFNIDFKKSQGEEMLTCPICSPTRKKKSVKCFGYNHDKDVGRCNHCNESFYKKKDYIVKKEYTIPEWTNNTKLPDTIVEWFKSRKISQTTLMDCNVGYQLEYMPQLNREMNCICFNYFRDGELVNIKYRDGKKNFKLHKGCELIFYNLDNIKDSEDVIIVEGEMDCLTFVEAGFKNVISVPNGAGLGNINLEYLDNCIDYFEDKKTIYLAVDNDKAGNNLRDELARRLGFARCKKVFFGDYKDANDLAVNGSILDLKECIDNAVEYPIEGVYTATNIKDQIERLNKYGLQKGKGITIDKFNDLITFETGYLTVITGIPNHGKSEFLDQIVVDLNLLHGWKAGLFSPENYPLELHFSKIASKITGLKFGGMKDLMLRKVIDYFDDNFYFIMPPEDLSLDNILNTAEDLVRRKGIKMLIIDAWNKLEHYYTESETQYISKELDKIDAFCRKFGVHCFLVAHPKKIQKDKEGNFLVPNLYDISGSANFYNKAANGITVYRRFTDDGKSTSEVYIQKVKFKQWGNIGSLELNYDLDNGRYNQLGRAFNKKNYLQIEYQTNAITPDVSFDQKLYNQIDDEWNLNPKYDI